MAILVALSHFLICWVIFCEPDIDIDSLVCESLDEPVMEGSGSAGDYILSKS